MKKMVVERCQAGECQIEKNTRIWWLEEQRGPFHLERSAFEARSMSSSETMDGHSASSSRSRRDEEALS
jgi:hypothetical protein